MLLLGATSMMTSCSDWLDVSPKTEVREDDLFSSESGYKNAISGVYILLGQKALYGVQASMYVPEFLAHNWATPSESKAPDAFYLAKNDYKNSNVETTLDNLWSNYYNAIAQINNILTNIESSKVRFSGKNKEMMTGELYGLRAFLHLDILRFFGPVPDGASGSVSCIPYVKDFTTDVAKLKSESYDAVKADILADLDKAEVILKDCDPLVKDRLSGDSPSDSNSPYYTEDSEKTSTLTDDEINRQLHFNYWAVLGAKARYYYWIGDKQKAVEYAQKVIDAKDAQGKPVFTLCDEAYLSSVSNANRIMKSEHLFGVYNSKINDEIVQDYYTKADPLFTQKEEYTKVAYEVSVYPDDSRYKNGRYWSVQSSSGFANTDFQFMKYFQKGSRYGAYTIPVMRLSEMYFIVFEDAALAEMKPLFSQWRLARGLDASIDNTLTSESTVLSRMEKEWRKEFMGEGQMFFFYKKHNYSAYTWPTSYTVPEDAYVLPKPQSQTIYE